MLAFEQSVRSRLHPDDLAPVALVDEAAPLDAGPMLMAELAVLEPYGRVFDPPTFYCDGQVLSITPMGDGTHLKLRLQAAGSVIDAVWFRAVSPGAEPPVSPGSNYRFVVQPSNNTYRGRTSLQWQIRTAAAL
jgi:single-stranded-DNA-specific exonuclease